MVAVISRSIPAPPVLDESSSNWPVHTRTELPEHDWVFTGRLPGQAPEIDPQVYLTEADPATLSPGQFLEVEIVGAEGYDLVARPLDL